MTYNLLHRQIDTAQIYRNEAQVGAAVKASASKVAEVGDKTTASVQSSLKKLDLGYIDLYLIHSGHGGKAVRLQTYRTLLEFAGPAKPLRSIGVSNYGVKHLEEIREAGLPTPTVNQIQVLIHSASNRTALIVAPFKLHPFCQQKPIVEYCRAHGIAIQAYCPLLRGDFSNPVIQEVAKEVNKTPAQVLSRWSIQKGFVPLPKSSDPARVISNADIYDFELSDAAIAKLDALDRGSRGSSLKLQGRVLIPANGDEYKSALQRNSPLSVLPAKYIVQPAVYSDIALVLAFAALQNPPLEIAIKGGGVHSSTWSSSDGGVVIDLSSLRAVTVSDDKSSVKVQGGALWGDVYEECRKSGIDVVGAPLWFVGVGGFLTGGGYGPLSGSKGLAADNILSATVVLADGQITTVSASENSDLFWAIRGANESKSRRKKLTTRIFSGGGGQFGVLAEVELKAFPQVGPITSGILVYPGNELRNVLKVVQEWKVTYSGKEKLNITFSRPGPLVFKPAVIIMPWVSEDENLARSKIILAPFREGPIKPLVDKCSLAPDTLTASHGADASVALAPKRLRIRGALFADYYEELIIGVWERWVKFTEDNEDARGTAILWDLTHPKKLTEVTSTATAVRIRDDNYWVAVQGRTNNPAADGIVSDFVASTVAFIRNKNTELSGKDYGYFLSMAQGDENPADIFGDNLARLSKLKSKFDPKNVFKKGVAIPGL
ncbi:hypothetical protein DXG01_007318 [Tephrocybe rancida]|nr:hypothetical protein DXG01_007318 [Tephrocybe rancida]